MAIKKSSSFGADEGLFFNAQQVQEVTPAKNINHSNIAQEVQEVKKELGTTQGKKGQKLKRINMAFSDSNHEYITRTSRQLGISSTAFVNQIIDEYKKRGL